MCCKAETYFADKGLCSQSHGFSISHVWMSELDHKESWAPKNLCFWIVVLEKALESPLDSREIQPVHPKGNQPWIFIGRTDAEAEVPILWLPDTKSWLLRKDPDAGIDWGQEEKGVTGWDGWWYHWRNVRGFEQIPGDSEEWGMTCYSSWGHKESDTTERLSNNKYIKIWAVSLRTLGLC